MEIVVSSDLTAIARHANKSIYTLNDQLRKRNVYINREYIVGRVSTRLSSLRARNNSYGNKFKWRFEPINPVSEPKQPYSPQGENIADKLQDMF